MAKWLAKLAPFFESETSHCFTNAGASSCNQNVRAFNFCHFNFFLFKYNYLTVYTAKNKGSSILIFATKV